MSVHRETVSHPPHTEDRFRFWPPAQKPRDWMGLLQVKISPPRPGASKQGEFTTVVNICVQSTRRILDVKHRVTDPLMD